LKLNDALNLDIPLYDDNDTIYAHVYSQPISTAAFEANYRLLVRTFEAMMSEGRSALRMANLFLRDAAKEIARSRNANDDGIMSVYMPLVNEITRLSVAVVATPQGWDTIPLQQAIDHGKITPDDGREALSAAIFFTAASHVPPRQSRDVDRPCFASMGCVNVILAAYGVDRFVADLDRNRHYWRDGAIGTPGRTAGHNTTAFTAAGHQLSVVAGVLAWAAGSGFPELCEEYEWDWSSAAEFRARHVVFGIARLLRGSGG